MDKTTLFAELEALRHHMEEDLMSLISIPAIAPENGGEGEEKKAQKLLQILKQVGFDRVKRLDAPDERVASGHRPNILAYLQGESDEKRLWIITHLDVVPPGEQTAWTATEPFKPTLAGDYIYGRGSEDNGQSLIASIYAAWALKRLEVKPKFTVGLAFVADEEQGSGFGIQFLLDKGIFKANDLVLVPDAGNAIGSFIEVAEKSILWFKLHTVGKQTHGSLPNKGLNAHRIGMEVALALDKMLHEKYSFRDYRFDVAESTFEPTKKEQNVDAVNVVPGEDVAFFDCRVLPSYSLGDVIGEIESLLSYYQEKTGAKITLEVLQKQESPETETDAAEIVGRLKSAIKEARNVEASVGGIGGGSCAAFFRKRGIPAVVWCTIDEVAHQPNEYSKIDNLLEDAKVLALLAIG